ncbi:MAG: DUF4388 domain-containing protein [Roseiflexaceae bacterium]|nr:DUF4388 domain-containing protein [Roseiflexaceae bacterium]
MQLASTLAQFPLSELIPMTISSSVTGVIEINLEVPGRLFFRDGQLYHAEFHGHSGMEAVCELFELADAPFCFSAGAVSGESSLWQDSWEIIEAAERHVVVWRRVRQYITSFEDVPQLEQGSAGTMHISDATWPVLAAIDGQRNILAIAEHTGKGILEVAAGLCELIEQSMLSLRPPERRLQSHTQHAAPAKQGFFGRLMANTSPDAG